MSEKIIRDPVHDVIVFRLNNPEEAMLFRVLNTPEFQRLRRVRQLGMAHLAYPGADHSRNSHSLGVMETARRILDRLGQLVTLAPEMRAACLAGALLHDIGHGPLSHAFEEAGGIEHEEQGQRIILDPASDVHSVLIDFDPGLPQRVVALLRHLPRRSFYSDILSSQLDADRLDYLLRDNLMTGSRYGEYDLSWLLWAMTVDSEADRLAVSIKGLNAVEAYLQSRYHMYRNVYFHKVVRSAEGMFRLAMQRARRLAVQDRLPWPAQQTLVSKSLLGQQLTTAEFTELDDVSVLHCFKTWSSGPDVILARLCRGLLFRRVYKTIDLTRACDAAEFRRLAGVARQAVIEAGGDGDYDIFSDEISDVPYAGQTPAGGGPAESESEIWVRLAGSGPLQPFTAVSPLPGALGRQLAFRRIHVAPEYHAAARGAVGG